MKVRELLSDSSKWTKGPHARNSRGETVRWGDKTACCWCLLGALNRCYQPDEVRTLYGVINERIGGTQKNGIVGKWNDAPERTYAEVKSLVDALNI